MTPTEIHEHLATSAATSIEGPAEPWLPHAPKPAVPSATLILLRQPWPFPLVAHRRARKVHRCCECHLLIAPGDRYEYAHGVWAGQPASFKTCARCAAVRKLVEAPRHANGDCLAFGGLVGAMREDGWPSTDDPELFGWAVGLVYRVALRDHDEREAYHAHWRADQRAARRLTASGVVS